ncbi:MAG: hypothetical protein AAF959_06430 [Cyanobacteria bacterium P01_D01_bin.56]
MTSQKDQIQSLIAEIEAALAKPASRLSLGFAGEPDRQRQLLGKLYSYLQSLEQMFESPGGWGPLDPDTGQLVLPQASDSGSEEAASQVLQGLLLEMRYLRENALRPMRQELESLQQKRESLQAEINLLEGQRGTVDPLQSEEQMNAFLETLMQRLQEQLSSQMVQNFAAMEAAAVEQVSAVENPAPLLSGQRLEQVRLLQSQSDELLLKLDTTLTAVFDSLQKSVDSYRDSLEEGLSQMHGLGRQGEVIFHAFINHLAQQLGQDASSYLTGDAATNEQMVLQDPPVTGVAEVDLEPVQLDELDQALENLALEEELGDATKSQDLDIDPDLALLADVEVDEDIALIQSSSLDLDEDLVLIGEDIGLENGDMNLDEDITVIQSDIPEPEIEAGPLEIAIAAADDASEEPSTVDDDFESSELSLNVNTALEDIDESLGLLAVGAESTAPTGIDNLGEELNPSSSDEPGEELFKFDLGVDEPELSPNDTEQLLSSSLLSENDVDSSPLSDDLLAFSFADDGSETPTETELLDANQVSESWLFEQSDVGDATEYSDERTTLEEPRADIAGDSTAAEPTVENLFGDSTAEPGETISEVEAPETIVSLSDLLPDTQSADTTVDVPESVPDDIYIPASADEDLINLVESDTEQRLLIELTNEQLVEQLDQDLQKLANDTSSPDYQVDDNEVLAPIDQNALETVVEDLNLLDLDLNESFDSSGGGEENLPEEGVLADDEFEAPELMVANPLEASEPDLFEEFPSASVDVDDPSSGDLEEVLTPAAAVDRSTDSQDDLDILGLGYDPLNDEDDGIPDSLADELDDLNQRSNALSLDASDDDELLFDLEEPVIASDEMPAAPSIHEASPSLDSASVPDVPLEFEDDLDSDLPDSEEFLQAEQQAFLQTIAVDETAAPSVVPEDSVADPPVPDADTELATDFDDLLALDDLAVASEEPVSEGDLDLDDLDDLFGQSALPDLEELDQGDQATTGDESLIQSDDASLTELGLDMSSAPEVLVPQIDAPTESLLTNAAVVGTALPDAAEVEVAVEPAADVTLAASVPPVETALPAVDLEGAWFLGLDIGSTGLSAVLMNRQTGQVYPLYWQTDASEAKHFRLPALAVMTAAQETVAVGYDALGDLEELLDAFGPKMPDLIGVNRLKPLLKVAVGHGQTLPNSDPWLRWSDTVELPMLQILQAMVALLKYAMDHGQAVGLDGPNLSQVMEKLQGVIVGYPTNWPDTYSFNLREAVLAAGVIEQPEQVVFVEDAIATILSGLPDPHDLLLAETVSLSRQPSLYNCNWQEGTVVISAGATMTELALVNLPKDLASLNYADFALRSFAYAGDALDQDIVCQLLIPHERRQPLAESDTGNTWDWQGHLSGEDADWNQLNLGDLTLPTVGHVDWVQRYRLQQRLLASNLGQSLLAAARHIKLALQQPNQNQVQISLAGQRWLIRRRHLENLVFLPYIQRINRYLNVLLSHHTVDAQSIKQVVCTGGSASLPAIARLLRQKFPNATIIQDTYAAELPQSCSRVAYGLVNVARYPQVFNITRQQYSDYFLLMELLRVFPQQPLPVGAIMHLLEQRGINTQACHLHILALLEGHLPPGLVPTTADRGLICDRTTDLPTYRALLQTPLFNKTVTESGGQIYIPNEAQAEQLRAYCNRLLLHKAQTLEDPLLAHIEVPA